MCREERIVADREYNNWIHYLKSMVMYPEIKIVHQYRKAKAYTVSKNFLVRSYWKIRWLMIRRKTGCQISLRSRIGKGFRLLHAGTRIIVGPAVLGENCTIGVNVIIGYSQKNGCFGAPRIGDRVYIGHNSSIVGDISIGSDVLIAPNSYVNRDVPSHSVVIGNNIVIHKENASAPYLNLA